MRWLLTILFVTLLIAAPQPLPAQGIDFVSSTSLSSIRDVKVSGSYAYCASDGGLLVLSIGNPAQPTQAGQLYLPGGNGLFISGTTLFLTRGVNGLDIIDIATPSNPLVIGHSDLSPHAHDVFAAGNYAYVADDSLGLSILNITNPANPALAGELATPGTAEGICVSGSYAYIADGGGNDLQIINISDPASPVLAASYDTLMSPTNVFISGAYAYVANFPLDFVILNISSPVQPYRVSRANWPIHSRDIVVAGDYAYTACEDFGLEIYNISNPAQPTLIGSSDTLGTVLNMDIAGNFAFVADRDNGLYIINIAQPATPYIAGNYRPINDFNVVAVSGNYVYGAENYGFRAINVTIPSSPGVSPRFMAQSTAKIMFTRDHYLFTLEANTSFSGFRIYDTTFPSSPGNIYSYPTAISGGTMADGYFYAAGGNQALRIFDIQNPAVAHVEGTYDISDTVVTDVVVSGNYAFLIGALTQHRILDITDRAHPVLAGFFTTPFLIQHTRLNGNYIYATTANNFYIIDISNPLTPVQVGELGVETYGLEINNASLFVYGPNQLLNVYDLGDPASPSIIGTYPVFAKSIAFSGDYIYTANGPITIWHNGLTGLDDNTINHPRNFALSQNYPNPFNPTTTIQYDLPKSSDITIEIFDLLGRKIETLVNGRQEAGHHSAIWDGQGKPSGIYFYKIQAGDFAETRKMLLLK